MENFLKYLKLPLQFCIFAVLIMQIPIDNYIYTWLKRSLFALAILSICRILFIFYLFPYLNGAPLSQLPLVLFWGVLFDVQASVYFLAPFHILSIIPFKIYNKHRQIAIKLLFVVGVSAMVLLNFIDMEFFKVKTRRSGIELFQLVADKSNPIFSYIFNYWWLMLLFLSFIFLSYRFYPKAKIQFEKQHSLLKSSITFLIISALLFLGARGSISVKPLRSFDASAFVDARWVSACINSPTQLITSYSTSTPSPLNYFTDEQCLEMLEPEKQSEPYFKDGFKPNVVLIILESFGRDYCGFLNKEKRFTPFLDSLSEYSLIFSHAYSSGTTSMESLPAIFASVPSLLDVPYINSNFQSNNVNGVHHYLSKNGFDCSFYYGARNGSMGFDNFLFTTGKIQYYGMDEYPDQKNDFDGNWGIWDEEYLEYFSNELNKKSQPFFSSVFTLTSHDPYQIPEKYSHAFTAKELPIHKSVQYTDFALRKFFERVWKSSYFDNTIFIITADHPSHSKNEYFYTPTGKYEIPLMIYAPKLIKAGINDSITASHPDIMPTILRFAGVNEKFFSFGTDLMNGKKRTAINMDYGIAQLIDYPYCIRLFPGNKVQMHVQPKYVPNKNIRYNLTADEEILKKHLENELKAKYQLYINSLLYNRFNTFRTAK